MIAKVIWNYFCFILHYTVCYITEYLTLEMYRHGRRHARTSITKQVRDAHFVHMNIFKMAVIHLALCNVG